MNPPSRRSLNLLAAFVGPPMVMTAVTVALGLTFQDELPPLVGAIRVGFFVILIPGFYFVARELHVRKHLVRGAIIALVYFVAMFWVTIGAAFYLGIFILGLFGRPVSF